ncbi:MAG: DUF58 domain-containing protein, partial [Spirochaetota bacterium]|nr:DUF58 domain-containing protein [Spirochaetota bacterium]
MLYNPYVMGVKALQTANLILLPLKYVFRRIKIAFHKYSPLTLRGLFVLLLCIYGYFISEKKNDFFLLILSIGGIGTFGILLIFNFMQFFLSIYLLKRNQDLISFQLAFHEGEINQEIPYTFVTKGLIVIPFFKLSITILFNHNSKLKSSVDMDKTDPIIVYLFSKKKIEINNNVIFRMRGYYNLDKIEISSLDRLRFTRISWKKVLEEDIIIYPQLKKRKEDDFYPSTTKEDMLDSTHRYLDGDYYEHRLYEVGDDVRRINWKLSAKRDELFIKIPEMIQPLFREILIFLSVYNPYPHYYNSNEMKLLLEDLVTGTASHVNILSNLGFKVFLGTDSSIDDLKNAYELKSIMMHLAKIQWE